MYVSMHSLQLTAPTAPTDVNVGSINSTYAIISWSPPECPNAAMIQMYIVMLTDNRNVVKRFNSTVLSVNATRLEPFVTYSVVVYAQTVQVGEESSVISFMTLQDSKQTL